MKASVSSWSYREWFNGGKIDLLGFVDEVKRLGGDGLEIFPKHVNPDDVGGHLKEVADKASAAGLEIASVIAGNDFAVASHSERADTVERMKAWIGHTADAGITRMNTFTGYHRDGQDPVMEAFRVIDCYREVMPIAEDRGVALCIENHSSVAKDADGLLSIIRAVGSDQLKTNPDPSNFVPGFQVVSDRMKEAIYTETEKIVPLAENAHLKIGDFNADGEHTHVDTARFFGLLKAVGYDGHVVLEVYGDSASAPDDACAKGLALLRKYM
jgi:hydroxypyruvate isomerase